jgi:hypothetical protein
LVCWWERLHRPQGSPRSRRAALLKGCGLPTFHSPSY